MEKKSFLILLPIFLMIIIGVSLFYIQKIEKGGVVPEKNNLFQKEQTLKENQTSQEEASQSEILEETSKETSEEEKSVQNENSLEQQEATEITTPTQFKTDVDKVLSSVIKNATKLEPKLVSYKELPNKDTIDIEMKYMLLVSIKDPFEATQSFQETLSKEGLSISYITTNSDSVEIGFGGKLAQKNIEKGNLKIEKNSTTIEITITLKK